MSKKKDIVSNRVFIGCPWKTIRPKYLKIVKRLEHSFPIHFVLIGRESDQRAEELLTLIKKNLLSSSMAIFDVTGGNPNVSLEYGIADASDVQRMIYLNVHGHHKADRDSAIIADLAGQKRKQWKNEQSLTRLLNEFSRTHNYTKRFEAFLSKTTSKLTRHEKKSRRTLALKAIHFLNDKDQVRRTDIVESLLGEGYNEDETETVLRSLHAEGLIFVASGRYSQVRIS
jgi:hypothetical protein